MRSNGVVAKARWLVLLLPVSVALAQAPGLMPLLPPPQPPGNPVTPAKANLGKALFWDEQLSSTRTVACGSCHQAGRGGSDPRSFVGATGAVNPGRDGTFGTPDDVLGSPGVPLHEADGSYVWSAVYGLQRQVTGRHSPSHINAAYAPQLFWDGRAAQTFLDPVTGAVVLVNGGALENQAAGPPVSSAEMAHLGRDWSAVAAQVAVSKPLALATSIPADLDAWIGDRTYPELFQEAFGSSQVTPARIAMAIASYERTLFSNQTPFDSTNAGQAALTPAEAAGMQLFGTLPCARCHAGALTSDNQFHYIGLRPAAEDSGRAAVTGNAADLGAFRTPVLRNVSLRPAFMHNGRFGTLAEVVDFYNRGGDFNAPNKSPLIQPLGLGPVQRAQLVAFLSRPLTDPRVAASTAPFDRPSLYSESPLVPAVAGVGVAGAGGVPQAVAIEPPLAGNPSFTIAVFGARGGAEAVLVIDDQQPQSGSGIPASGDFARVAVVLDGTAGSNGSGSATMAIPDDPALYGRSFYGRWYVTDPSAPGGVAESETIYMQVFGPRGAGLGVTAVASAPAGRTLRLHASRPNPFAVSTSIRFDLFKAANIRLVVFDVSGRAVRHLVNGELRMPGSYAITWDGRSDGDRAMPGGIYFYRLETDGAAEASRVILLD